MTIGAFIATRRRPVIAGAAVGLSALLFGLAAPGVALAETLPAPTVRGGQVVVWGTSSGTKVGPAAGLPADLDDAVAIATTKTYGANSSLAIRADGSVVGWGSNAYGEATPPADLDDAVQVDVTAGLGIAVTEDGSVVAWGDNRSGGLDVPADLGPVTSVAVGGSVTADGPCNYALAVKADGSVVRWGESDPALPCFDMSLDAPADLTDAVAVSANARGAVALKADRTVASWGRWFNTQWDGKAPGTWSDITQVSFGSTTVIGRTSTGAIAQYGVWGESGPGLVGPASTISAGDPDLWLSPAGEIKAYRTAPVPSGEGFQAVAAGNGYGVAIAAATGDPGDGGEQTPPPPVSDDPALGSDQVQPSTDSNPAGTAESFRYTATADLRARTMRVYVDKRSTARMLIVGVYTDRRGEPGALVATGRTKHLKTGWNTVDISRVDIENGEQYWLSVLTPVRKGTLRFRDLPDGQGGPTRTSAATRLTARSGLPIKWKSGRQYGNAPASIYLG